MRLLLCLAFVCSIAFSQLTGIVAFTGSMYPTYRGGEHLLLEPANKAEIGDVVVFQREDHLIVHRVICEFRGCYITKGDNEWFPDLGCADIRYIITGKDPSYNQNNVV